MLVPDHETEVDFLNCEAISQTVSEVLRTNRSRPLTIGIHGDWGAGKSSILQMIKSNLSTDEKVVVLWFNGWTFEGFDDAKTVLIESTITELRRHRKFTAEAMEIAKKLLLRINWLKAAKRGLMLSLEPVSGLVSPENAELAQDIAAVAKGVASNADTKETNREGVPETIHAFREDFKSLLDEVKIDQLVILIDDLDRCLPKTAIQTLEAIRLFLFVPKTAFVIGADETMIEYAVRQHFPDLPREYGPLSYTRSYLEKLIQVPFRIPALGAQETRAYVILLLVQAIVGEEDKGFKGLLATVKERLQKPWEGANISQMEVQEVSGKNGTELDAAFVLAQQIAPILADGTKGNPRQIKRFLNALLVRQIIANARGFGDEINQPVLAKLMLAERFQTNFYDQVASEVMRAENGVSSDVANLEAAHKGEAGHNKGGKSKKEKTSEAKNSGTSDIDTTWVDNEWLRRWCGIEPSLGGIDLRPYVFVARDKRLLTMGGTSESLEFLVTKLCGSQLAVRSVEEEVKALPFEEASSVFSRLRDRTLSSNSWETTPQGMDGLFIVAKHHPRLQGDLVQLIGSQEVRKLGPWVVKGWNEAITDPEAKTRLQGLLTKWAQQGDNKVLKKAAENALNLILGGTTNGNI